MYVTFDVLSCGSCGRVVRIVDLKSLVPHRCGFEFHQILSCEEAIQLAYGMLVVLLMCLFMPEIMP